MNHDAASGGAHDDLIRAANKHAESYADDDRPCIVADVMNAFFAGAKCRAASGGAPREPSEKLWRRVKNQARQLRNLQRAHDTLWKVLTLKLDRASPARQGGEPSVERTVGCVTISEYIASLPPEDQALIEEARSKVRTMLDAPSAQPVQGEAVAPARGYAHLGIGAYIINHSRAGEVPELCISLATDEDKRTRTIGDSVDNEPDSVVRAEDMVVRLRFENAAGLGALETQLRLLRGVHFPDPAPSAIEHPSAPDKVDALCDAAYVAGLKRGYNIEDSATLQAEIEQRRRDYMPVLARAALQGEQSPAPKCSDGWACTMPDDCPRRGYCIADAADCDPAPSAIEPAPDKVRQALRELVDVCDLQFSALISSNYERSKACEEEHRRRIGPATEAARAALQGEQSPAAGAVANERILPGWAAGYRQALLDAKAAPRPEDAALTDAERDVIAERKRQIDVEGWTPDHDDDEHDGGDLATVAAHYAIDAAGQLNPYMQASIGDYLPFDQDLNWPWERGWWKPGPARRNLVKAGALILAEIERIDRAAIDADRQGADK